VDRVFHEKCCWSEEQLKVEHAQVCDERAIGSRLKEGGEQVALLFKPPKGRLVVICRPGNGFTQKIEPGIKAKEQRMLRSWSSVE